MVYSVYTEQYKGFTLNVVKDEDAQNPRTEWDNMGKMVCFHRHYALGDKHKLSIDEVKAIAADEANYIALPLFLYDHSGITMNTTGFACPWDSGQVGIIYVSKKDVYKEYGVTRITKTIKEKVLTVLRGEVETYDQYLRGEVYGYQIQNKQGETLDSCYGYYGDYEENALKEARDLADWHEKQAFPLLAVGGLLN